MHHLSSTFLIKDTKNHLNVIPTVTNPYVNNGKCCVNVTFQAANAPSTVNDFFLSFKSRKDFNSFIAHLNEISEHMSLAEAEYRNNTRTDTSDGTESGVPK